MARAGGLKGDNSEALRSQNRPLCARGCHATQLDAMGRRGPGDLNWLLNGVWADQRRYVIWEGRGVEEGSVGVGQEFRRQGDCWEGAGGSQEWLRLRQVGLPVFRSKLFDPAEF